MRLDALKKCYNDHIKNIEELKIIILTFTIVVAVIGLFFIFRKEVIDSFINYIVLPFFSKFQDNNLWGYIGIVIILLGICSYIISKEWNRCTLPMVRYVYESIFLALALILFFFSESDFYSDFEFSNNSFALKYFGIYILGLLICIIITEIILGFKIRKNRSINTNSEGIKESAYVYDVPTDKDDFNRREYAEVIVKKILATFNAKINETSKAGNGIKENSDKETDSTNAAFVINISESYGYGKSSFLRLLKKEAKEYTDKNKMVLFEYKPWLCDSPQKIISEFFNLLNENLSRYIPNIGKSINRYVRLLLEYYSSKNALVYVLSNFFKEQSSISEERKQLKDDIKELKKPIVILIDDVDRLRDEELLTLFSLLRNTADFPNLFYILASDMTYVKHVLDNKKIKDPELYIKKFINFEFVIPGFDIDIMGRVLDELLTGILDKVKNDFKKDDSNFVDDIIKGIMGIFTNGLRLNEVFTSIRDIKRFCNNYATAIDCYIRCNNDRIQKLWDEKKIKASLSDDIDLVDLFFIELLKYLNEDTYKILRDRDDLILEAPGSIQLKGMMRYTLNDEYKEFLDKVIETPVGKYFSKKNNNQQNDSGTKVPVKDCQKEEPRSKENVKDIIFKNSSNVEIICIILKSLFQKDYSKLGINSLCYKDPYFRYFSYRFKNDQVSVNEVINMVKQLNIDDYKIELEKVLSERKTKSFIHKIRFIENNGSLDASFIEKLFLFVDMYNSYTNENEINQYSIPSTEEGVYTENKIFDILFYWYEKRNYEGKENLNLLKKSMSKFILGNNHINLLSSFLKDMFNNDNKDRLIFSKLDISYWISLLLNCFFNDGNSKEIKKYMDDLIKILQIRIIGFRWMSLLVIHKGTHFILNELFIKNMFRDYDAAMEFVKAINEENIEYKKDIFDIKKKGNLNVTIAELKEDLISLLNKYDISNEKIENHLFLQYAERVNKEYLWDDDLQKLVSSVQ